MTAGRATSRPVIAELERYLKDAVAHTGRSASCRADSRKYGAIAVPEDGGADRAPGSLDRQGADRLAAARRAGAATPAQRPRADRSARSAIADRRANRSAVRDAPDAADCG